MKKNLYLFVLVFIFTISTAVFGANYPITVYTDNPTNPVSGSLRYIVETIPPWDIDAFNTITPDAAGNTITLTDDLTINSNSHVQIAVSNSLTIATQLNTLTFNVGEGNYSNLNITNNGLVVFNQTVSTGTYDGGFGTISGDGAVQIDVSAGNLRFVVGTHTYSGNTTILRGPVSPFSTSFPNSIIDLSSSDSILNIGGTDCTIGALQGVSGSSVVLSANLITGEKNSSTTYAGSISGTGNLTKDGTGTFELSGANSFTGTTTVTDGTLNVSGTLACDDISVANDKTLQLEFDSTSTPITCSGTTTIGTSATVIIQPKPDVYSPGSYTLIDGTVSGTFDAVTFLNEERYGGLIPSISYGSLILNLSGSSSQDRLFYLHSDLAKRIIDLQSDNFYEQFISCIYKACDNELCQKNSFVPYVNMSYGNGDIKKSGDIIGDYYLYGPTAGLNYVGKDFLVGTGFSFLYGKTKDEYKNFKKGNIEAHNYGGAIYGLYKPYSFLYASLLGNFCWSDYDVKHHFVLDQTTNASPNGWEASADLDISFPLCINIFQFRPMIGGKYYYCSIDSYNEKGGTTKLSVEKDNYQSGEIEIGIALNSTTTFSRSKISKITPEFSVKEIYRLSSIRRGLTTTTIGTNTKTKYTLTSPKRLVTKIEGSLSVYSGQCNCFYIRAAGLLSKNDHHNYEIKGGLKISF
jgi:autotransporter-associated beta strand protein